MRVTMTVEPRQLVTLGDGRVQCEGNGDIYDSVADFVKDHLLRDAPQFLLIDEASVDVREDAPSPA